MIGAPWLIRGGATLEEDPSDQREAREESGAGAVREDGGEDACEEGGEGEEEGEEE